MTTTSSQWIAYSQAIYQISSPSGLRTIKPGTRHGFLDRLLECHGASTWALITAYNPRSVRLPAAVNRQRQRLLQNICDRQGFHRLKARGGDRAGQWDWEESCLLLGIGRIQSLTLARRFGQNAILFGRKHGPAMLLNSGRHPKPRHISKIRRRRS